MGVFSRRVYTLDLGSKPWRLGDRTLVMGILNVTPDSFSDGGQFYDFAAAVGRARQMIEAGADILDIGGESTRPASDPVSLEEELQRVLPVIQSIRKFSDIPLSIDTTKAEVARQAISAGADIINDISSLQFDERMADVAAQTKAPLILMHIQGTPKNMQQNPSYASLFSEIVGFLEERIQAAVRRGVDRRQIIVDPGIGFGKTVTHNLQLIRELEAFHCLNAPVLLGTSRKRYIGTILDRPAEEREVGSAVAHSFAIQAGIHILRVHDVAFHKQVAVMGDAIREAAWNQ
jgi:dihydropteroate synthase